MNLSKQKNKENYIKKIAVFFYVNQHEEDIKLGGAERRLSRILDELSVYKFECHVVLKVSKVSPKIKSMYESVLERKNIKIQQFKSYLEIMKYIKRESFDWICYTDSYRAMVPFVIAGLLSNCNRMMLNVTTYASELKFINNKQRLLFEFIVKVSNHLDVLYPNGFVKISEKYPEKNVTLTPGAFTNLSLFKPKEKQKKIVFLASLIENKNPQLFIEAIHGIKEEIIKNGYTVQLCGSGPLKSKLQNTIKEYGCNDIINVMGNVLPQDVILDAEIFISIQNYNNYPSQSLLEAISSGCYIIASDEGDTKVIVKEQFGVLCKLSAESIGNEIISYMGKDEKKKIKVIKSARNFALNNFKIEQSVQHYKNLFS